MERQRSVKLTQNGYTRLWKLKMLLRDYYRRSFSFEQVILWMISQDELKTKILKIHGELNLRNTELSKISNPLEVKTVLDELPIHSIKARSKEKYAKPRLPSEGKQLSSPSV